MLLSIHCPGCQFNLRVGALYLGRTVRCPDCGARFLVAEQPSLAPAPPVRAPAAPTPAAEGALLEFQAHVRDEGGLKAHWKGTVTRAGLRLSGEAGALALVPVASREGEAPAQYKGNN